MRWRISSRRRGCIEGAGKRATKLLLSASLLTAALTPAAAQDLSSCKGNELKRFIGKPVKEMQQVRKDKVRYVCEGCPITMDFSPERLTVIYSEKTGLVVRMSCN